MKAFLRTTVAVAAAAASIAMVGTPADAAGAVVFTGTANIDCFGCGVSTGTAELTGVGTLLDPANPVLTGAATANYTVNEPDGATCVVTGAASGTVTGAVDLSFNWTRVGAVAVITTSGDVEGAGVALFVVTSPVGNPCGGPVTAQVVGVAAGA
jgi:hypothetical protein